MVALLQYDQGLRTRVHSTLGRYPWAKLWYLLRALDKPGSGLVKVYWSSLKHWLGAKQSTIYEWLRQGKLAGAFLGYKSDGHYLTIALGSRNKVCKNLQLRHWGFTALISVKEIIQNLRGVLTGITTQALQEKSHRKAIHSLTDQEQKVFRVAKASTIIKQGKTTCSNTPKRVTKIPCLLHVSDRFAFVSRGFIPHGVSQERVGNELGITDRTVRRHLKKLDVESRQIVQAKGDYDLLLAGIYHDIPQVWGGSGAVDIDQLPNKPGHYKLTETNGLSSNNNRGKSIVTIDRFFKYWGKTWLRRCNVYDLSFELVSSRTARRYFRRETGQPEFLNQMPCYQEAYRYERSRGTSSKAARQIAREIALAEVNITSQSDGYSISRVCEISSWRGKK